MSIAGDSDWIAKQNGDSAKVMQNLTQDAHANRITAAAGVNPNTTVAKQVKNETTSKEYATLKEALGKADRGQTVALTQEMVTEQNRI